MEIRVVVFLGLVAFAVLMNTALVFLVYKGFAGATSKLTKSISEVGRSGEIRRWITSVHAASQKAVSATEATKRRMAELDPVLGRAQEDYKVALARIDASLEKLVIVIETGSAKAKDIVTEPAFAAMSFAAEIRDIVDKGGVTDQS